MRGALFGKCKVANAVVTLERVADVAQGDFAPFEGYQKEDEGGGEFHDGRSSSLRSSTVDVTTAVHLAAGVNFLRPLACDVCAVKKHGLLDGAAILKALSDSDALDQKTKAVFLARFEVVGSGWGSLGNNVDGWGGGGRGGVSGQAAGSGGSGGGGYLNNAGAAGNAGAYSPVEGFTVPSKPCQIS